MRIAFMGTPEFAVASLRALVASAHEVVAVVTATDKLGGRGGKTVLRSAVARYADEVGLPVLQPRSLRGKRFCAELRGYRADLQVVVAFRMLPELVWAMPPLGTINLHGSLLPAYRGAAPIHWAVIRGERETGVTTFFLQHAIDTGDVLLQRRMPIGADETTGEVHDRMMALGAEAVVASVDLIARGKTEGTPQDASAVSQAPKLSHEAAEIDWRLPAARVHDFIRGMSPFPAAWTQLDGRELKVLRGAVVAGGAPEVLPEGTLVPLPAEMTHGGEAPGLAVTTGGGGLIELLGVKPAGKRAQTGRDLRNGLRLTGPRPL